MKIESNRPARNLDYDYRTPCTTAIWRKTVGKVVQLCYAIWSLFIDRKAAPWSYDYRTPCTTAIWRKTVGKVVQLCYAIWSLFIDRKAAPWSSECVVQYLKDESINVFYDLLTEAHTPQDLQGVDLSCIINFTKSTDDTLYIPINLKGRFRNHIVFFAIHCSKSEIFFFDSQGQTVADYGLTDFLGRIETLLQPQTKSQYTFVQNVRKYQYDGFLCAVHAATCMAQMQNSRSSFAEFQYAPPSFSDATRTSARIWKEVTTARQQDTTSTNWDGEDPF